MEILSRRLQFFEEAVADNPDHPSFDGASYFMGVDERRGGALLDPSIRAHVAAEMIREAAIVAKRRKTRENKKCDHGGMNGKGAGRGSSPESCFARQEGLAHRRQPLVAGRPDPRGLDGHRFCKAVYPNFFLCLPSSHHL